MTGKTANDNPAKGRNLDNHVMVDLRGCAEAKTVLLASLALQIAKSAGTHVIKHEGARTIGGRDLRTAIFECGGDLTIRLDRESGSAQVDIHLPSHLVAEPAVRCLLNCLRPSKQAIQGFQRGG